MKTAPLSTLLSLAPVPLPQYRASVATAYHAVFQTVESGGFSPEVRHGFPSLRALRRVLRRTTSQLFDAMGRCQLDLWVRDLNHWLALLSAPVRERLVGTMVLLK